MEPQTQTLSSNRTNCNSPEFEFWMLRNPSFPQPDLLSADELFVDGVLLPLHLLPTANKTETVPPTKPVDPPIHEPDPEPDPSPSPSITDSVSASTFSSSKRWKDIFRKSDKKTSENNEEKEKVKKEKKSGTGTVANSAELNINIWPFSRSRSAGNAGTRPKLFAGAPVTRKVNSAPCSRSNSAGESKSRKWPNSPGRPGVHVGRSSPVWQVRRTKNSDPPQKPKSRRSKVTAGGIGGSARVLNLNVPMCIGYRHHLSCSSDENSTVGASGGGGGGGNYVPGNNNTNSNSNSGGNDGGSGVNIFNLRNLFAKKCVVTSH